jgi:hypothetical protein
MFTAAPLQLLHQIIGPDRILLRFTGVNGSRNLTSWRQLNFDQLGFIGRRP